MAADDMVALPSSLVQRCTKFVQRSLQQKGEHEVEAIHVAGYLRGHGEQSLGVFPLAADTDPGDLGQELAQTIHDCDDADRALLRGMNGTDAVATQVITLKRPAGKDKGEKLLGTEARDTLLTTAIRSQEQAFRMIITDRSGVVDGLMAQLKTANEENAKLRREVREADEIQRRYAREDREMAAQLRIAEAQAKAIEQLSAQVMGQFPRLANAITGWVTGKAGLPPAAAEMLKIGPILLDVVRDMDGDQITMIAGMLDEKGKTALVRAWELAQETGPKAKRLTDKATEVKGDA